MSLVDVSDTELERLAMGYRRALAIGRLSTGLSEVPAALRPVVAASLPSDDPKAALLVVEAVLAERRHRREADVDLVWTGPHVAASEARDTAVVVRELFACAEESVLVAGFSFDHGADIFRPLHVAMRDRKVDTSIFLDVRRAPAGTSDLVAHARRELARFIGNNWPFGLPEPRIFHDPRTLPPDSLASLHAKCIVIDERKTFITSANFTNRGHQRNVEVGVVIDNPRLARQLVHQWRNAAAAGLFVQA